MGFSKKKQKNFVRSQARVGSKVKKKIKNIQQIQDREELKASKRRGNEAAKAGGKAARADDDFRDLKSVDALFASMGDEDDDASDLIQPEGSEESDDESSAGAFHDVGDDDDEGDMPVRGVVEELDDEEDGDAGLRHEEELKAIKEKDPEFYKFLVEQDRSLLNFQAPADEAEEPEGPADSEDDGEGLEGEDVQGQRSPAAAAGKLLDRPRLERIQASAKESWTATKAALNIYHTAVRSLKEQQKQGDDQEDGSGGKKGRRRQKAKPEPKRKRGLFRIEDESIFSEVIEWSLANLLPLLQHHAGDLKAASGAGSKKQRKGKKHGAAAEVGASGLVDPTNYSRWSRVKVLANIFFEETLYLLTHVSAQNMLEYVLRQVSSPEALSWLWPFKPLRQRYVRRCCQLWSTASAHNVRLLSFLVLRNSAAMILHAPDGGKEKAGQQLEALLRAAVRSFAEVAAWGFSWKALNTFRFMENCLVELLRLDDSAAYRLGYVCLRQLALILRNACMAASHGTNADGKVTGSGEKGKKTKKQKTAQQQAQALVSWPFVRAISLWTRAVGSVPSLKPLAYPLSMVVSGAMKHKLTSLQHFPFVYHCLLSLNKLAAMLEVFVPVSSHLLKALGVVSQAIESMHKKRPKGGGASQTLDSSVKAPEMEVVLRLTDAQLGSSMCLEAVGSSVCFLFTDHLGLLSQSPAFPEMVSPIMLHLRKHSKHCKSEPLRKQLKSLIEKVEASVVSVRVRRDALTEVPSGKKLLVFAADAPLGKARTEVLKRRAAEERLRVQAEVQDAGRDKPASADGKDGGKDAGKKKRKGEKPAAEEAEPEPKPDKKKKRLRAAADIVKAGGALPNKDKVEEMGFSSGDEE